MSAAHDRAFFEQMAACREPYRRLADAIHAVLGPHRVLDIGAGLGFVAARLAELGWDAAATDPYAPGDLKDSGVTWWWQMDPLDVVWFGGGGPYDVIICTEVAEHIEPGREDVIAGNVAAYAKHYVVWSAAQPGQEWPGHVNLQPPAYWLDKFRGRGFDVFEQATVALRAEMATRAAQHHHAAHNFFVLSRST